MSSSSIGIYSAIEFVLQKMRRFISMAATILEQCQVTPSSGAPSELLLPLTYCDVPCLPLTPLEHLFFYAFPCSESHFSQTIIPQLKNSLSLTLKHFPPLAGNIIFPLASKSAMPVSRYVAGDSISLTVALSDADLSLLTTKNLSTDADQFHHLVARFGPANYSTDFTKFSVAAIQATLFPDQGICIGITTHHAIADGSTILHFLAIWSSIAKFKGDDSHLLANLLPFYDRSRVQDVDILTKACWDLIKSSSPMVSSINFSPTNKVRATFVLTEAEIRRLNDSVVDKKPSLAHLSSFAVLCAYVWTCLATSAVDEVGDDEPEYIVCPADIRGRLNPPLPQTYFGNCLALSIGESTHGRLKGDQGIFVAAVAIWEAIQKTVNGEKGILDGFMNRLQEIDRVERGGTNNRLTWIAGSPRFDVYVADLGWGSPKSYELVNIDCTGSVFFAKSREFKGGVEITLSRTKAQMDAFAAMFNQGLTPSTTPNQVSKL